MSTINKYRLCYVKMLHIFTCLKAMRLYVQFWSVKNFQSPQMFQVHYVSNTQVCSIHKWMSFFMFNYTVKNFQKTSNVSNRSMHLLHKSTLFHVQLYSPRLAHTAMFQAAINALNRTQINAFLCLTLDSPRLVHTSNVSSKSWYLIYNYA